jgi:hypothetical protein
VILHGPTTFLIASPGGRGVGLDRLVAGIADWNLARGMNVFVFVFKCCGVLCRHGPLRRTDHSLKGVLLHV